MCKQIHLTQFTLKLSSHKLKTKVGDTIEVHTDSKGNPITHKDNALAIDTEIITVFHNNSFINIQKYYLNEKITSN